MSLLCFDICIIQYICHWQLYSLNIGVGHEKPILVNHYSSSIKAEDSFSMTSPQSKHLL